MADNADSSRELPEYKHIPVLYDEVIALLAPVPGDVAVDGTTGLGGHAGGLGRRIGRDGVLVCFDQDPEALGQAKAALADLECSLFFVNARFETMPARLAELNITQVDRILLDLGVSSLQLDKPERGFSFRHDGPLDMRMNPAASPSAAEVVNTYPEEALANIFYQYGEERFSRRIAKRIVDERAGKPIYTTGELSELVAASVPGRGKTHPATRVFQALRIEVNDELGTLSRGLANAGRLLSPGGRLAVLTFHSLEDRLVKKTFARWRDLGVARLVNAKAAVASRQEALANRRARSAKLRVVEKV